jgi:hypothetical protein
MMKTITRLLRTSLMSLFCLSLVAGGFLGVTAQQPPMQPDILAPLKGALSAAGAPPLTAMQEEQLRSIVTTFRGGRRITQNTTLQAAHRAYDEAIVAGDLAAAQAQAGIIATQTASSIRTELQSQASFKVQVIMVLKTNDDQVGFLVKRFGSEGVSRVLGALAGGGGPGGGPSSGAGAPRGMAPGFGPGQNFNPKSN